MRTFLIVIASVVALCAASVAQAQTQTSWVPGTTYYVSEEDAGDLMTDVMDQAYCSGIKRFGRHGDFPYEEFNMFDCTGTLDDKYCTWRAHSVRAKKPGYWRVVTTRLDCWH